MMRVLRPIKKATRRDIKLQRKWLVSLAITVAAIMIGNLRLLQRLMARLESESDAASPPVDEPHSLFTAGRNKKKKETTTPIAGLNCDKYGGPSVDIAAEMVYWRDIPSDAAYTSPYANYGPSQKYLTFEPDEGGWNNIRMSMETATVLAVVTGRTLVLPKFPLDHPEDEESKYYSFQKVFPFNSIALEHSSINIITMEEFLKQETFHDNQSGKPSRPPGNKVDWDDHGFGAKSFFGALQRLKKFWLWLRSVSAAPVWNFEKCVVAIGKAPGVEGVKVMQSLQQAISEMKPWQPREFNGKPTPVDGPPEMRMKELLGPRRELCIYDDNLQNAKIIHFMGDNDSGARLLTHFYSYIFMEDWHQDLWVKRFVRDHLRYIDEIQCAAARVVHAMRQKAREHGNPNGIFDTFHIRRGDFQYQATRIEAEEIYSNVMDVLQENTTIYIATDERNLTFFDPLREHYHLYFLQDFSELISSVNKNYYGMIDQVIASRGRTFIGTYFSTFTGYINRMRGYHAEKDKLPGHEQGGINSFFYIPKGMKYEMQTYRSIKSPMWAREFPIGWRDIDKDIGGTKVT